MKASERSRAWVPAVLLALLIGPGRESPAQQREWRQIPGSPEAPYRHSDASFVDDRTGWVVGTHGTIYHTDDGGATWTLQLETGRPDHPVAFRSVGFANDRVGWVGSLTRADALYETRDAGRTWTNITDRIEGPEPSGICGIWVVSDSVVYAVGAYWGDPRFLRSVDGGRTWQSRDMSPFAATLVGIRFFDENRGVILGGVGSGEPSTASRFAGLRAIVLMTEDGGRTWSSRFTSSERGEWGWHFEFPTPSVGYASVESLPGARPNAKVLKTTDGGLSWSEISIPDAAPLQGIGFLTERVGWTSGRGTSLLTTDGGRSWQETDALDGSVNRFLVFNDTLAYAFGRHIYRYSR